MFFARKFQRLFSLFALLLWVHMDACAAYALVAQGSQSVPSIKTTPVAAQSSSGKKGLATIFLGGKFYPIPISPSSGNEESVAGLFDRNIETAYTPADSALLDFRFEAPQAISEIRLYGPASYVLTVQRQINGQWGNIDSCTDLDLSIQGEQWYSYPLGTSEKADALRLQLVPIDTGPAQGIREIEFWSPGQHEPVRSGVELHSLLDYGVALAQGRQYQAEPALGVVGPEQGTYTDAAQDNTFRFDLAYRPEQIKRAYLSYELSGLTHWTGAIRTINEQVAMGGSVIERSQGSGVQVEEIAPAWLRQGTNSIRFVPVDVDSAYTVSKVQVLIELDDGANFVSRVSTNMAEAEDWDAAAMLYDGDTGTGLVPVRQQATMLIGWERQPWQVLPNQEPIEEAAIELEFDRLTDLSAVGFYVTGKFKGTMNILLQKQGDWVESTVSAEQDLQDAGWYYLHLSDGENAQAVRLLFDRQAGKGAISEVRALGSNLGRSDEPSLTITYPDAGQYFAGKMYVRGFASPDNGSGEPHVYVGDQEIFPVNGEFETLADVGDVASNGSNDVVEVRAVYPDGETLRSFIPLVQDRLQENSEIEVREYSQPDDGDAGDGTGDSGGKSGGGEDNGTSGGNGIYDHVNLVEDFAVSSEQEHSLDSQAGAQVKVSKGAIRKGVKIRMMTLRDRDLPALDAGMVNVTGKAKGFRFLPHGMKFDKKVKVKLPYNKQLIPPGFKDDDVRTYFFDEAAGRWSVLERDSVDTATSGVVSETDHFTDMINAVVQVPESPEKVNFSPTQIKDIKVSNPAAKVNLIEPPQANNQGDARLSYPLEVPPGRQGLQPQLAVQYSSGGGNGWMGMGWDLSTQAVSIDTRWGVPRYDADLETETYTLSGQQLTPLAHRTELVERTAEKIFHARTEGAFQKIIRHGDHPAEYWWEVFDKNGTRFFYGGDPSTGLADDAVLKDYSGNVAKWALRTVLDSNGNSMRYHYVLQEDSGVGSGEGGVPGYELYLDRITYTGYGSSEGPFEVRFLRDRQLDEARRTDVGIDARLGFKKVIADLLRKVEVSYQGEMIRSYAFGYRKGAFEKTLLETITQFDKDGKEFNSHQFEYFDEARNEDGAYKGFGASENWDTGDDGVDGGLIFEGDASAVGGSKNSGGGGHLYAGLNLFGSCSKDGSFGGKVGFNRSNSKGLLALTDVNGDGLADKVFGSGSVFRPNLSGPDGITKFGEPVGIGLGGISKGKSKMTSGGAEIYLKGSVGVNRSNTSSETSTYLSDVNGDGLTDLVANGAVRFGRPDDPEKIRPVPEYGSDSAVTPYPIGEGAVDGEELLEDNEELYQEMLASSPLHDTLRRWTAPYDGQISINGQVALKEDTSEERAEYTTADGVRVAIQHNGSELWDAELEADDYSPVSPENVDSLQVGKGDHIYFRIQSRFDGAYDQVEWNPEISYQDVTAEPDANGLDPYQYQAGEDFIPTGRTGMVTTLPVTGTVSLSGDVEITAPCTDDVTVKVLLNDVEQFSQTVDSGQASTVSVNLSLDVTKDDQLEFKIETDSPIDATQVRWQPHLEYTTAEDVETLYDPDGNPVIAFDPPYTMDIYGDNDLDAPLKAWTATQSGTMTVKATIAGGGSEDLALTIKRDQELVAKKVFTGNSVELPVEVAQGEQLYFELSTRDRELGRKISSYSITAQYGSEAALAVPAALNYPAAEGFFGQPYRGWTYAGYKADGEKADQPIIEADLVVPAFDEKQFEKNKKAKDPEDLDPQFSPEKLEGIMFYPDPARNRWKGFDDSSWVTAEKQSSSRLGEDYISVPKAEQYAGARAVSRLSKNRQTGVFGGISSPSGNKFGASASSTRGKSKTLLDFMDMNGDRFPDVVSTGGIQYSPMTGGLEGQRRSVLSGIRASESDSLSFGVSGNFAYTKKSFAGLQMQPLGVSGGFAMSGDEGNYDLSDINGDGLPDKLFSNGNVALNLGYAFAAQEHWGAVSVSEGESENINIGAGLGAGFNDGIYGFGGGVNLSKGEQEGEKGWTDINGDGLRDYVRQSGGALNVALNTGNGFVPMQYPGADNFSESVSFTQGGGFYFTIGIPIPLPPPATMCIIINPGADFSKGMSRPEVSIQDIDGDGFADHLFSERDNKIEVRRNQIGRTNLLHKVNRPLGANFTLEYERDGNTYQLPQSRWNLTRVEVFDGFVGDGVDTLVTTYKYADGFHHRQEREFFGYKTLTTEQRNATDNTVYRSTTQTFLNRNYYEKGLLVSEIVQDGAGKKYLETLNSYQLRDVDSGQILQGEFKDSLTATVFPEMIRTDKKFYEGQEQAGVSTYQTFAYDALGNVDHFFDAADAGAEDDVESFIHYHSDAANHIVGKADKIEVKSNGTLYRLREATIENGTGNIRQVRLSFGSGMAVHDLGYDQYGNIKSRKGPANKKGQRYVMDYSYDPDVHTYVTKIKDSFGYSSSAAYDLKWGEISRSTDLNNQSISYRHDSVGRVAGITGPYQQGTGRETIVFAYHPEAAVPWALTQHYDNYQQKTDPLETVTFMDGLKRALQTKKDGAVSIGSSTGSGNSKDKTKDMMIVSGRVIFDFVGRAVEQYYPVTENLGKQGIFNPTFDSIQPTRTRHDVLDRVLQTTIPDDTSTIFAYGFGKDRNNATRFHTKVTDAKNNSKETFKDVGEHITSVKEFNKGKTIWTSYAYDPLGQIVAVKDDKDNLTTVGYDLMGRRTWIDSPDAGLTEYVFDPASNLVEKITANLRATGKAIKYDYTYNRLDGIRYPDYTGNNVSYSYGAPGAAFNRADRIVTVTDESGSEERFYGPLGETVKTIKYVASKTEGKAANSPEIYITQYTYDTYNRLRQLIYPDNELLTYLYNSGGLAESASGTKGDYDYPYLKALTYDKFEQRVFMRQGNGAETQYDYNPRNRRLANLKAAAAGREFMDLSYDYDPVGNIMGLDNGAAVRKPNEFGGKSQQRFGYDDLYRLTTANGLLEQKPNTEYRYTLAMQYDSIHNIVRKDQEDIRIVPGGSQITQKKTTYDYSYAYTSSRPHAPTQIGERAFSYDANGNQTGWESDANGTRRTIVWDEENRIQEIKDNGHTMRYAYNDAGERVIKTGPQGETVYVNQFYSVRNREVGSKHVFVGTGRIVTKLVKGQENVTTPGNVTHPGKSDPSGKAVGHSGKGNNGGGSGGGSAGNGTIVYEKDIYYYHPDHLGSSTFISDADGELYQHLENFPFGETWVEESTNTQRTPYHFTAKELDEETGLYYFGARYYDPRTSVWQSPDPILGSYLPTGDKKLPGMGGVFNSANIGLYTYTHNNPMIYIDPDGKVLISGTVVLIGALTVVCMGAEQVASTYVRDVGDNIGDPNVKGWDMLKARTSKDGYIGQFIGGLTVIPPLQEVVGNSLEKKFTTGKHSTMDEALDDAVFGFISGGLSHMISKQTAKNIFKNGINVGRNPKYWKAILFGKKTQKKLALSFFEFGVKTFISGSKEALGSAFSNPATSTPGIQGQQQTPNTMLPDAMLLQIDGGVDPNKDQV
ncbi:MAG: SpvB/TcaC N-terminal domain-containing protein [Candidatus Electrothrix sp. Rat3]|nr:SpvB/TcaC N-terminal domain-containing protein [Candidatus Electrothrix rattekaaiensis]